jgi:hypothetical protein
VKKREEAGSSEEEDENGEAEKEKERVEEDETSGSVGVFNEDILPKLSYVAFCVCGILL